MNNPGSYQLTSQAITAAGSVASTPITGLDGMSEVSLFFSFAYGSGGTKVEAYVQSTPDEGTTWIDLYCFAATNLSKTAVINLKTGAETVANAPTNGMLVDNSIAPNLVFYDQLRVLTVTTGVYGGNSLLNVRAGVR